MPRQVTGIPLLPRLLAKLRAPMEPRGVQCIELQLGGQESFPGPGIEAARTALTTDLAQSAALLPAGVVLTKRLSPSLAINLHPSFRTQLATWIRQSILSRSPRGARSTEDRYSRQRRH